MRPEWIEMGQSDSGIKLMWLRNEQSGLRKRSEMSITRSLLGVLM